MTKAKAPAEPVVIATAFESWRTAMAYARNIARVSKKHVRVLSVGGQWRAFRVPEGRYRVQGRPELWEADQRGVSHVVPV